MPKVVDHDARRTTIVEAALSVIATEGLERATVRRIAKAAGSTTGLVTHYFGSKDDILVAALRHVHRSAGTRMLDATKNQPALGAFKAVVEEALPLDDIRRAEWRIWLAFWGHAANVPELVAEQRSRYDEWTNLLTELVSNAELQTSIPGLMAVIDGVGVRATIAPDSLRPPDQLAVVNNFLNASAVQL